MSAKKKKKTKGGPNAVDIHVGSRLRIRRSLLGLSQEKLAGKIGITFQQIQKYERGLNRISAGRLYHIGKVLQVPVSYFFENIRAEEEAGLTGLADNEQEAFSGQEDIMKSKETLDLLRIYYSCEDPEKRKAIREFIKTMVKEG